MFQINCDFKLSQIKPHRTRKHRIIKTPFMEYTSICTSELDMFLYVI